MIRTIECPEKEAKKVVNCLEKNDRTISRQVMSILCQYCNLPYKMEVEKGIYTIKPIKE